MDLKQGVKDAFEAVRMIQNGEAIRNSRELLRKKSETYEIMSERTLSVQKSMDDGYFEHDYHGESEGRYQSHLDAHEAANTPGYILDDYRAALTDPDVEDVFEKFDARIAAGKMHHPGYVLTAFRRIAPIIPESDALPLAEFVSQNEVFTASLDSVQSFRSNTLSAMADLASRAPAEDRLKLFSALEQGGVLKTLMRDADGSSIAYFMENVFDGVDDDAMHMVLQGSDVMDDVIAGDDLDMWLTRQDPRFGGVLQYAHGQPVDEPAVSHNDM